MNQELEQQLTTVVRAIVGFPSYLISYVLGFYVILTEIEMTTMAIVAVLLGIVTGSVVWAFITFLVLWLFIKSLNNIVTIALSLREVAGAIRAIASTITVSTTTDEGE